jgi:hypothetical protein
MSLDDLLDKWSVMAPGMWENDTGPKGWFAVVNDDDGIVAYFATERDALRWRLDMINRELNP